MKTIFLSTILLLAGCEAKVSVGIDSTVNPQLKEIEAINECMEASGMSYAQCVELRDYQQRMQTLDNVIKNMERDNKNEKEKTQ